MMSVQTSGLVPRLSLNSQSWTRDPNHFPPLLYNSPPHKVLRVLFSPSFLVLNGLFQKRIGTEDITLTAITPAADL